MGIYCRSAILQCCRGRLRNIALSGFSLLNNFSNKLIFAIGFFVFAIDFYWLSLVFIPDVSVSAIGEPLLLQGFGQGWLFTPLVMFMITGLPPHLSGNGSLIGTSIRFWTTNFGFAFAHIVTNIYLQKNYNALQSNIDLAIPRIQQIYESLFNSFSKSYGTELAHRLSLNQLNKEVYNQSLLLANIQIFHIYMGIALITGVLILLFVPKRVKI